MLLNEMASRTYYLRTRTGTTQPDRVQNESPSLLDIESQEQEVIPQPMGSVPAAGVADAVRLYSEIVDLRPPSRSRERPVAPSGGLVAGPENSVVPIRSNDENVASSGDSEGHGSNEGVETPDRLEWTTVQRRRARSLGSFRENEKRPLTSEQKRVVSMAEGGLTAEQRQKVHL